MLIKWSNHINKKSKAYAFVAALFISVLLTFSKVPEIDGQLTGLNIENTTYYKSGKEIANFFDISDFIEVKCGNSFETIFESQNGLQKVEVENKRITISHLNFNGTDPEIKRTENVCGYEIEYLEVTSHKMYQKYLKDEESKTK